MMKLGLSTLACPDWDLDTIVKRAADMGYSGVELFGLQREWHLPRHRSLADAPGNVRRLFENHKVELVCLSTTATLSSCWRSEVSRQKNAIMEFIELASNLNCPYVRLGAGVVERADNVRPALSRVADALASLAPAAAANGVTLLVENGGAFSGSQDLWFLVDAVGHPAVQGCWSQRNAMVTRERPTVSVPRLANKIAVVHVGDAVFDDRGANLGYKPLGEGSTDVARQIELLKGILYEGHLIFEWPKAQIESLPGPEQVLPDAIKYLREHLEAKQAVLAAYKGDKYAPKMASPPAAGIAR